MKRFLGVLVLCVGIFVGVSAYADCASNEFAYTDPNTNTTTCITSKFQVTTTALEADSYFDFSISAAGTFYVDWGDGTVEKIERADADYGEGYNHTYENSGTYNIQFGGQATDYYVESDEGYYYQPAAISFSGNDLIVSVSGSLSALFPVINGLSPSFASTFSDCYNLTSVAGNMFSGLGTTPEMFSSTFAYTGITTIPSNLFAGVVGSSQQYLFSGTFSGCESLTGTIPSGLFSGVTGAPSENMFNTTFYGIPNMSCNIPANLFSGISGAVGGTDSYGYTNGSGTWAETFYGFCSNAASTTFIPTNLFTNITGNLDNYGTFYNVFTDSGLMTSCPTGYYPYLNDYSQYFDGHIMCSDTQTNYTFTITLDDNGGSGGSGTVYERYGTDWSLSANGAAVTSVAVPTRSGYAFSGYYIDGTRVISSNGVLPDDTYFTSNKTLSARWVPVYTITLNDNGGSGGSGTVYEAYGVGWSLTVGGDAVTQVAIPTRPGYVFGGYSTTASVGYIAVNIAINSSGGLPRNDYFYNDRMLYARWIPVYTITLDDNGGSGGMGTVYEMYGNIWSATYGGTYAISSVTKPTRNGYVFNGYWTAASGGDQVINDNAALPSVSYFNSDQILYAQWTPIDTYVITLNDNGGSGGVGTVYERYGVDWSLSAYGDAITSVTRPTKSNEFFDGYYTATTGGTQVIDMNGVLPANTQFNADTVLYAHYITAPAAVFWVGTTSMQANTEFSFRFNTSGVFYVDWDDGNIEQIVATGSGAAVSHTYTTAGTRNIGISGGATGYNGVTAISFSNNTHVASISGSLSSLFPVINGVSPNFASAFENCSNLTSIASNMFSGIGTTPEMFAFTFANTGITSIPSGLFAGVVGPSRSYMFADTFLGCSNLRGDIPSGLFSGVTGRPAYGMFESTFSGCSNMSCDIPANLFSGISGSLGEVYDEMGYTGLVSGENTWRSTFYGFCSTNSNSNTFIPRTLFQNVNGDVGTYYTMYGVFKNSGLATTCPTGYHQYLTGFESYWDRKVSCVDSSVVQAFTITLNDNGGSGGSGTVYERYDMDWSLSQNGSAITSVAVPTRSGYLFAGYYTGSSSGDQYINNRGELPRPNWVVQDQTLYAHWVQIQTPVFTVTTVQLPANTTFSFGLAANGQVYVNWGDGMGDELTEYSGIVSHTYENAGTYTIGFNGNVTGYNFKFTSAILFGNPGSYNTWATEYSGITPTYLLVGGISGSLGALFPTINGVSPEFTDAFRDCSNLTGVIPAGLFTGVTGAPTANMFRATFSGVTDMSCRIPAGLFSGITGATTSTGFIDTFNGFCADNANGTFIPSGLFDNTRITLTSGGMDGIFANSGLATACPCGTHQYITGFESSWSNRVACEVGVKVDANDVPIEYWYNGQCYEQCDAGITRLRTSVGLDFVLLKTKPTTLALNVEHHGTICYIPAVLGNGGTGSLNMADDNGVVYHMANATTTPPAGFTGQPS